MDEGLSEDCSQFTPNSSLKGEYFSNLNGRKGD